MVSELKELTNALTTPEMQREIQELKRECARYTERLNNIKAATNHVTPEEKEKVSREAAGCLCRNKLESSDEHAPSFQVYRDRQKYCREWRKRKRMVSGNPKGAHGSDSHRGSLCRMIRPAGPCTLLLIS